MNGLVMRVATEHDLAAILTLYRDAHIDTENTFTQQEAQAHFALLSRYPSFHIFVAILDQSVVGTYALVILDNMAKRGRKSAVVEDVAVHPQHQRHGVGRAMMQHAMLQCRQAACYKLTLSSNLKRQHAHRFYDSLGFTRHGYSFQVEL